MMVEDLNLFLCEQSIGEYPQSWFCIRDACFLDLGTLFWTCTCSCGPGRIFLDLGVFRTRWGFCFGPACMCAGAREIFLDSQINCFSPRFLFCGPVRLLDGPCLHIGWRGELYCVRRSHGAGCFWTLAPSFF